MKLVRVKGNLQGVLVVVGSYVRLQNQAHADNQFMNSRVQSILISAVEVAERSKKARSSVTLAK